MTGADSTGRPGLKDLRVVLEARPEALARFLEEAHPADIALWVTDLDEDDAWRVFSVLGPAERAEVIVETEDPQRIELLRQLDARDIVDIVEELPPDEAVDLLGLTDPATSERVLGEVELGRARELRALAAYGPETSGGEMTTEFVSVASDARVGDAIKLVKGADEEAAEEGVGVFVLDEAGRPVGFLSNHDLLTHGIHTPVAEVMETDLVTVGATEDREEAAKLVSRYSLDAIPVVDAAGRMLGILNADDALDVLEAEASEDMVRLAGAGEIHQTRLSVAKRVRSRAPLMAITVLGGLVTAWILDRALSGGGADAHGSTDLLRYLPIIIGLAGNVGIQSSTILVRAFATGEVEPEREWAVMASEVAVGLTIGLLCGLATMVAARQLEAGEATAAVFSAAVGLAIVIAVTWASFLGCIVPIGCRRLGIDPAIVAGPFLITLSDISGSAIFVGVAGAVMELAAS